MHASILLIAPDGVHLEHGAAPTLPDSYCQAIHGTAIGPSVGSCGTAAFLKKPVYVSDIANDPLWADHAELAAGPRPPSLLVAPDPREQRDGARLGGDVLPPPSAAEPQ